MRIFFRRQDWAAIRAAGEQAYPRECCGFLLGRARDEVREVVKTLSANNERGVEDRHNRYLISAEAFMEGERLARRDELDIIGFYHSHPDHPARPSAYDTEHAWPWYAYVIVSVAGGKAEKLRSWGLQEDRAAFVEQDVVIED
jgi:proteasome lid subunit RPN8/RPN11